VDRLVRAGPFETRPADAGRDAPYAPAAFCGGVDWSMGRGLTAYAVGAGAVMRRLG